VKHLVRRALGGGEDRVFITHIAHILVDDSVSAKKALKSSGIKVEDEREALVIDVKDRPGEVAMAINRISDVGINIDISTQPPAHVWSSASPTQRMRALSYE
jgi:hypothetical protein